MKITILGGGGFLGRRVAQKLAESGELGGRRIESMVLFDLMPPAGLEAPFAVTSIGGDIAALPEAAMPPGTDVVFHLAAVVSAAAEMLLADATRRGFLDAVCLRLPTIIVRPGRPNKAASSFFSAIVREPLLGLETLLPVPDDFAVWVASPRRATEWLIHAAAMDTAPLGLDRSLNPPGMSVKVGDILAALDAVRQGATALVKRVPDPVIAGFVGGWPAGFNVVRAPALGFSRHEPLIDVIRAFVADDLEATRQDRALG